MILENRDTVLFDLDGTLLPFRQEDFVHDYFGRLVQKAMPLGFDKDTLVKAVWAGTGAMVENDGSKSNCQAFWRCSLTSPAGAGRSWSRCFWSFIKRSLTRCGRCCGDRRTAAA